MPSIPETTPDFQSRVPHERQKISEFDGQVGSYASLQWDEKHIAQCFERELYSVVGWSTSAYGSSSGTYRSAYGTGSWPSLEIPGQVPNVVRRYCCNFPQGKSRIAIIFLAGFVAVACGAVVLRWLVFYDGADILTACIDNDNSDYQFDLNSSLAINIIWSPIIAWLLLQASTTDIKQAALYLVSLDLQGIFKILAKFDECSGEKSIGGKFFRRISIFMYGVVTMQYAYICLKRLRALQMHAIMKDSTRQLARMGMIAFILSLVAFFVFEQVVTVHENTVAAKFVFLYGVLCCMCFAVWFSLIVRAYYSPLLILKGGLEHAQGHDKLEIGRALKAQRFQFAGVAASSLATLLTGCLTLVPYSFHPDTYPHFLKMVHSFVLCLDAIAHHISALLFSGALSGALGGGKQAREEEFSRARRWRRSSSKWRPCRDADWQQKVVELAHRGISLASLLQFYREVLPHAMPDFQPTGHTTKDVVRRAIIPLSRDAGTAYSCVIMKGQAVKPGKMVTHNWGNLFRDLVAAVVSDALQENEYDKIGRLLDRDVAKIERWISHKGVADNTYWICAFCVSQHDGICAANPLGERDSVSGELFQTCDCGKDKFFNSTNPLYLGRSTKCEMNKLDDMIGYLSAHNPKFSQVIAVDNNFEIFSRAWCMAELAKASAAGMRQELKVSSAGVLSQKSESLRGLRVQDMQASRPEDVMEILAKIPDKDLFNADLHKLIFENLLVDWSNLDATKQMVLVGRVLRWQDAAAARSSLGTLWTRIGSGGD